MLNPLEFRAMLVVADYAASLRFYETLLGLRRVMAWDDGHGPGALLSLGPGRTLELRGARPGGGDAPGAAVGDRLMLGIAVADAQAAHDALAAAGVAIIRKLKDNPWGDRSFAVRDPEGVRVWVYQITDAGLAQDLGL
jgi:catechol 2,3-dioxygenase-like lactoylglutathione lyase family enzyme